MLVWNTRILCLFGAPTNEGDTEVVSGDISNATLKQGMWLVYHPIFITGESLKADRPHLRNYPHTPTNYRHTDKHIRLVTTPIKGYGSAGRARTNTQTNGQTYGLRRLVTHTDVCSVVVVYNVPWVHPNRQTDRQADATNSIIFLLCGR